MLKAYVDAVRPDFVALRGTPEQTQAAAKEFKVFFAKVPGKDRRQLHDGPHRRRYVFDTQGRVRLFVRYGSGAKALAEDLERLAADDEELE